MKLVSNIAVCGSTILMLSLTAQAQTDWQAPYGQQQNRPFYGNDPNGRSYPDRARNNDEDQYLQRGYGNDRYGYGGNQDPLIGRVLSDLDRAAGNGRLDRRERKHFDEAARQLEQFEDRRMQGKFDGGKIHEAIEELDHLVKSDRLHGRDREMLARDREELRRFSSSRGRYSDGYRNDRDERYNRNQRYDRNWR